MDVSINSDRILIMGKQLIVVALVGTLIGVTAPAIGLAEETEAVLSAPKVEISSDSPWYKRAWGSVINKGSEVKAVVGTAIKTQTDPTLKIQAIQAERDQLLAEVQRLKKIMVETRVTHLVSLENARTCVNLLESFVDSAVVTNDPVESFKIITSTKRVDTDG